MPVGRLRVVRVSTDSPSDTPTHLDRYLLETERVVVAVRRHPAKVLEPVLSAVAGLIFVLGVSTEISPDVAVVPDVLWVAWLLVLGRALVHLWLWHEDWFVATDTRLMLTYGVLNRRVAMMPLAKVTDMSYNRSLVGRVLGYGEFVLESAGQDQAMRVVSWLPNPDELYRRICTVIFEPQRGGREQRRRATGPPAPIGPGSDPPQGLAHGSGASLAERVADQAISQALQGPDQGPHQEPHQEPQWQESPQWQDERPKRGPSHYPAVDVSND